MEKLLQNREGTKGEGMMKKYIEPERIFMSKKELKKHDYKYFKTVRDRDYNGSNKEAIISLVGWFHENKGMRKRIERLEKQVNELRIINDFLTNKCVTTISDAIDNAEC